MLNQLKFIITKTYHLKDKIAFYPSIIALSGIVFSYVMFYLEKNGISKYLLEVAPEIVVNNTETSRTLLTTFIAGLISIMVFSFSMVMILLNQASNNFSPRLLPGLISNKRHQIILGIYIGTIIYCIIILVSIEENSNKYQLPGFSVLTAIFLMLNCLAAFIYFIHSISQQIQISHIMHEIFKISKKRLIALIEKENDAKIEFPNTSSFKTYHTPKTGYVTNMALHNIAEIAKKHESKIATEIIKGMFVLEGEAVFKSEKELDEETVDQIMSQFSFTDNELVEDNYVLAFKQLTEIIVKAMSPGINDPGTALNAIDYLSQLFSIRLDKKDLSYTFIDEEPWVYIKTINFETLLYQVMVAIRTYCKQDVIVVQKLIQLLFLLKKKSKKENYTKAIEEEINYLKTDINLAIKNEKDLEFLNKLIGKND
ncbi:DUF2254 domain-containing protein [Confluentibacter sediminis]|uniref:DUF2254 domain-containing protein n=1 Tax=Confluentibacter sediminis TaxID=2219045 RepID=UPI000DABAB68|nr:DUF2254 domain-containing protein [Confluentibacter sediminis]